MCADLESPSLDFTWSDDMRVFLVSIFSDIWSSQFQILTLRVRFSLILPSVKGEVTTFWWLVGSEQQPTKFNWIMADSLVLFLWIRRLESLTSLIEALPRQKIDPTRSSVAYLHYIFPHQNELALIRNLHTNCHSFVGGTVVVMMTINVKRVIRAESWTW